MNGARVSQIDGRFRIEATARAASEDSSPISGSVLDASSSDLGSQDTPPNLTRTLELLAETGTEPSVGSVGDFNDDALAKNMIGLNKTELIRQCGPWHDVDAVEYNTLRCVDCFSTRRPREPLGNPPPVEFGNPFSDHDIP